MVSPEKLQQRVRAGLLGWSAALIAIGVIYAVVGRQWSYAAIALGAITAVIGWCARRAGTWVAAVLVSLGLLAVAMIVAGALVGGDAYIGGGIVSLIVVGVGATVIGACGRRHPDPSR